QTGQERGIDALQRPRADHRTDERADRRPREPPEVDAPLARKGDHRAGGAEAALQLVGGDRLHRRHADGHQRGDGEPPAATGNRIDDTGDEGHAHQQNNDIDAKFHGVWFRFCLGDRYYAAISTYSKVHPDPALQCRAPAQRSEPGVRSAFGGMSAFNSTAMSFRSFICGPANGGSCTLSARALNPSDPGTVIMAESRLLLAVLSSRVQIG